MYDYVIVGAGPAGLAFAQIACKKSKVLVIESNSQIGGAHRVERVDNMFSEHGPRIYSTTYIVMKQLFTECGINFQDIFTKSKFTISTIGSQSLENFTIREMMWLSYAFILPTDISMQEFTHHHDFSARACDYINRLCRLTDGAGSDRYSVKKFVQLINQQSLHTILQPKLPTDQGFIKLWRDKLVEQGVVFKTQTQVVRLNSQLDEISSCTCKNQANQEFDILGKNWILAIPPRNLLELLQSSQIPRAFGDHLVEFSKLTDYNDTISVVFHWNHNVDVPRIYGFPTSDWKIAFIILTDYMDFNESRSKFVVSTVITDVDAISSSTKLTARQSNPQQLINEITRQISSVIPAPPATNIIISPQNQYVAGKWQHHTTAYINVPNTPYIPFSSMKFKNLSSLGTHNGASKYAFTSFESAVSNSVALASHLKISHPFKIKQATTLKHVICVVVIIIIIIIITIYQHKFE